MLSGKKGGGGGGGGVGGISIATHNHSLIAHIIDA